MEEQSIFGRYSHVVLMKGILWYLSYLLQAAAIQENFVPRDITGFEPPDRSPRRERYNRRDVCMHISQLYALDRVLNILIRALEALRVPRSRSNFPPLLGS